MKWNSRIELKYFKLTSLAFSMACFTSVSFALEMLPDYEMREIDGQDGLMVNLEYSGIDIDRAYWSDQAGTSTNTPDTLQVVANLLKIDKNSTYNNGNYKLGANLSIDIGANSTNQTGVDFNFNLRPMTLSVNNFQFCANGGNNCDGTIGNFALQTSDNMVFHLKTKDGFLNKQSQADLELGIKNINVFTGLETSSANRYDQLILKNLNFNLMGKGAMYIDPIEGMVLTTNLNGFDPDNPPVITVPNDTYGYVDFTRVQDPDQTGASSGTYGGKSAGLNLEFLMRANTEINPLAPVYNLDNAKGLIRVGASGRIVNGMLQIRGIDGRGSNNILGYATAGNSISGPGVANTENSVMGSSGIGLRLRGDFTSKGDSMLQGDDSKATTLEIGGAGTNAFGFEFSQLEPLIVGSTNRAYFDSGNVYFNLATTKHLEMPVNQVLTNSRFGGKVNEYLTSASDYIQQIHDNPNGINPTSFVLALRGGSFQALSKRGRFTSASDLDPTITPIRETDGLDNQWGLGLPFYNLNTNMALYSTNYTGKMFKLDNTTNKITPFVLTGSDRIGFALALSVEGKDATGSKTTSILVIDGGDLDDRPQNGIQPVNYYMGLRNIDMLLKGYGSIGFEQGTFNVTLPDLLMVMSAEIAAGYLPGAKYKSAPTQTVPINAFNTKDDILLGLKIKLLGDINFSLVPNNQLTGNGINGGKLSIIGEYKLIDGTVQVSDPIDDSMLGLDRMSGLVAFNNAIGIEKDNVSLSYSFEFNPESGYDPDQRMNNVFRVRDINLYPPLNAPSGVNPATYNNRAQRLGEMVMTGGRLNMDLNIRPRN